MGFLVLKLQYSSRLYRVVITRRDHPDGKSTYPYIIRSYDHEDRASPNHSRELIGSSPIRRSVRANPGTEKRSGINYEKAQELEIWQVARAGTALPFYFAPLRIRMPGSAELIVFQGGAFNPTPRSVHDVEEFYGANSVGVVVSIETLGLRPSAKRISTIPEAASKVWDVLLQQEATTSYDFPCFRIRDLRDLPSPFDDWRPRKSRFFRNSEDSGRFTVHAIEVAFAQWASEIANISKFQDCASRLVANRRERMKTAEWERYATACQFKCHIKGCDAGVFLNRRDFKEHLSRIHDKQDERELHDEVSRCMERWQYKTAGHQGTTDQIRRSGSPAVETEAQVGAVVEPTDLLKSVVDTGVPNTQQEDAKRHLLDPAAYFSELENLEMDVAIDCRIRDIFSEAPEGTCQSVDLEQVPPGIFLEPSEPRLPGSYGAGIPAALLASENLMIGVMRAFHRLRERKFCGNSVNLIVASGTRSLVAEIIRISRGILEHLSRLLQEAVIDLKEQADGLNESISTVETASEWMLDYLGLSNLSVRQGGLQRTTKLIQLLCLGMTSYAGSHASDFHKSCLDLSVPVIFKIGAPDAFHGSITLQRQKLSCLDKFVGGSVWVFSLGDKGLLEGQRSRNEAPLALATSIEEFADLWGPAWITESDDFHLISHINVERGIIYQPRVIPFKFRDQLSANEVACHWCSWKEIGKFDAIPFAKSARLLIGIDKYIEESRFAVNPNCSKMDQELYTKLASENEETVLNTDRARHALETHNLNLGASKIVNVSYTAGIKRIPARTLKAMLILDWSSESPSPQGLDSYLGLEISACTGNAQRVKLWEILNVKEVQSFIQVAMVDELPDNVMISGFWDAFRKDFDYLIRRWNTNETFRIAARRVIRKVIQKLDSTGIDEDKRLRAWWPDEKAHRAFKFDPNHHRWVHMLDDSNTTAVFAIISKRCFQYFDQHGIHCHAAAKDKGRTVLRTAVKLQQSCGKTETPRTLNIPKIQSVGAAPYSPDEAILTRDDSAPARLRGLEARLSELGRASRKGKSRENGTPNHPIRERITSNLPHSYQNQGESRHRRRMNAEQDHKTSEAHASKWRSNHAAEIKNRPPCKSFLKPGDVVQLIGRGQLLIRNSNRPQLAEWKARGIYNALEDTMHKVRRTPNLQHQELLYDDVDSGPVYHVAVG